MRGAAAGLLTCLLVVLGAAHPAAAAEAPPWKAGAQVGERLFDAQAALLLDEGVPTVPSLAPSGRMAERCAPASPR